MLSHRIAAFWIYEWGDGPEPQSYLALYDKVGVFRLMWRGGRDRQLAILALRPKIASEWLERVHQGYMTVNYIPCGRIDRCWKNDVILELHDLRPTELWINRLSNLTYEAEDKFFYLDCRCRVIWRWPEAKGWDWLMSELRRPYKERVLSGQQE